MTEVAKIRTLTDIASAGGWRHWAGDAMRQPSVRRMGRALLLALALVAATTVCLLAVTRVVELKHISSAYLIPVLIAAIKLGVVPAIVAAIGGVGASAFFFYPPIYDFRVSDPQQLLDLPLFIVVATVTGQLAARARAHALLAREREGEVRVLYAFSKRLAAATDATQIYAAIQDHLSLITGCRVLYFEAGQPETAGRHASGELPAMVATTVREAQRGLVDRTGAWIDDNQTGTRWFVRPISPPSAQFGLVAIDVGNAVRTGDDAMQQRIDAVLADATATLERLDVARAIAEAKLRTEAETLRAALMGSVSHGLRTPLASIVGSASILVQAPAIQDDHRLSALADIVRDEAERLNSDIQRLLDASRISSAGVRPHIEWADAADIVNAAVAHQRRSLAAHEVRVDLADDLPLLRIDPVLTEQALCQILDNAAKYSPKGSAIDISAKARGGDIVIAVRDEGSGLDPDEHRQMFEQFYRGPRTRETASGSGLGLWVASAFVAACGGHVEAVSEGAAQGATIALVFPKDVTVMHNPPGALDE